MIHKRLRRDHQSSPVRTPTELLTNLRQEVINIQGDLGERFTAIDEAHKDLSKRAQALAKEAMDMAEHANEVRTYHKEAVKRVGEIVRLVKKVDDDVRELR